MKALFQQLWELKVDWDDEVPGPIQLAREKWREELPLLAEVELPRCYFDAEPTLVVQLHGFCECIRGDLRCLLST